MICYRDLGLLDILYSWSTQSVLPAMNGMISMRVYWPDGLGVDFRLTSIAIFVALSLIFALVATLALVATSKYLANVGSPPVIPISD
jgi:hypothetical protein